jgi:hypothetical protein
MTLPFYLVNAFTLPTSVHSGNQAAVVLLPANHPKAADDEWKQLVARDFNYAETAFVEEREDGAWGLRWFTPAVVRPRSRLDTVCPLTTPGGELMRPCHACSIYGALHATPVKY